MTGPVRGEVAATQPLFPVPVVGSEALSALRALWTDLKGSGYERTEILPLPGGLHDLPLDLANVVHALRGERNLLHRSAIASAYRQALRLRNRRAADLHVLFFLCDPLPRARVSRALPPGLLARLIDAGVLVTIGHSIRSRLMITPFDGRLYASDPLRTQSDPEHVYMGRGSFLVSEALRASGRHGGRLLEVGSGSGIGAISASGAFAEALGVDIVGRCIRMADLNAALGGVGTCRFSVSDLYSNVEGTFDAVLINPPSGWTVADGASRLYAGGGGDFGSELPARMLAGALDRLRPGGVVYETFDCPVIRGDRYVIRVLERVCAPRGARAVVRPLFEGYRYSRSREYRRLGITRTVRYLVAVEPAGRFDVRFERGEPVRVASYRLRSLLPRLAAMLTGGPRGSRTSRPT